MIIWTGAGFLVAIVAFGCLLLSQLVTNSALNNDQYYQTHGWPKLLGFLVAAAIVWRLGAYLNAGEGKVLIDPETGEKVVLKKTHSLFFIRMEHWAYIFVGLGVIFMFV